MTAILGGGISGLSAAYYLLKSTSHKVTILEKSSVVGGWVRSINDTENGVLFEKGPRTIRPGGFKGLNTLTLLEELDLSEKLMYISTRHSTAQNRLIYVNKKFHTLPSRTFDLFKTIPPFSKPLIFSAFNDLTALKGNTDDESIYSFVERRFGKEVAEYIISSMICGICAGDAKEISVNFLLSAAFEFEKKHGSVLKGYLKDMLFSKHDLSYLRSAEKSPLAKRSYNEEWSVWSLRDGLQLLPETLFKEVQDKGAKVKLNSLCTKLEFLENNQVSCSVNDGNGPPLTGVFDHIISSLPASSLASLVAEQHPTLSQELSSIKSVTVAVVNIAYRGNILKYNAFGFLAPPSEKLPILGVIFDSCNFEYKDWTVLTVMMGGKWYKEYFGSIKTDEEILNIALKKVSSILQITQQPDLTHVSVLKDCIPQYTVGHNARVIKIIDYIKKHKLPLSLIGSSYHGVGINDVIFTAKNVVDTLNEN